MEKEYLSDIEEEEEEEEQYSNDSPIIANGVSDHEQSFKNKRYCKAPVMIIESDNDEYQDKENSEEEKEREEEIRGDRQEEEGSGEEEKDKTTEEDESDLTFVHNEVYVTSTSKAPLCFSTTSKLQYSFL